jgi:hypothetical protein
MPLSPVARGGGRGWNKTKDNIFAAKVLRKSLNRRRYFDLGAQSEARQMS